MKLIKTGQKRSDAKRQLDVIVDDSDFEWLSKYHWQADRYGSVKGRVGGEQVLIHRLILDAAPSQEVDHIDGDRLNNQRSNLRLCTSSQNKCNRGPRKDSKSGFKGVSWHSQRNLWTARIQLPKGKYIHLGLFEDKIEAAKAYNKAASKFHGAFAFINPV